MLTERLGNFLKSKVTSCGSQFFNTLLLIFYQDSLASERLYQPPVVQPPLVSTRNLPLPYFPPDIVLHARILVLLVAFVSLFPFINLADMLSAFNYPLSIIFLTQEVSTEVIQKSQILKHL